MDEPPADEHRPSGEPGDDAPPTDQRVPPYVALIRIGAVIGMSVFLAFGLFFFIGGWWGAGIISMLFATPFFAVMRLAENLAAASNDSPGSKPQ